MFWLKQEFIQIQSNDIIQSWLEHRQTSVLLIFAQEKQSKKEGSKKKITPSQPWRLYQGKTFYQDSVNAKKKYIYTKTITLSI